MTDFTNCPIVPGRAYNGANGSKIAVEYGGGIYMLKFPPSGERKPTNLSYTNSCISEHLASSIFNLIGINAQKTELGTFSMPAFADDPLTTINNLSDFVFSAIKAIGAILLGFGIVQIGLALKGHDASQRAQGFMTFFGGVVIYFAKDILDMIL